MKAAWNKEGLFRGNAQKCADELATLEKVTAKNVVEYATQHPDSELYKCFEWDDQKAAAKWREHQARNILLNLVIAKNDSGKEEKTPIRLYYNNDKSHEYKPIEIIVTQKDEHDALLAKAWEELRAFKRKYECLKELSEILALI